MTVALGRQVSGSRAHLFGCKCFSFLCHEGSLSSVLRRPFPSMQVAVWAGMLGSQPLCWVEPELHHCSLLGRCREIPVGLQGQGDAGTVWSRTGCSLVQVGFQNGNMLQLPRTWGVGMHGPNMPLSGAVPSGGLQGALYGSFRNHRGQRAPLLLVLQFTVRM